MYPNRYRRAVVSLISTLAVVLTGAANFLAAPLSYDQDAAFAYAKKWCQQGNDCKSGQYQDGNNTDCTHFMSHILKSGGVSVPGGGAQCDEGLCIRVKELAVWFSEATTKYSNVKKVASWKEARKGDFCFLQATILGLNLGTKYHVMLLADAPEKDGAKVYGHENNRCGDKANFDAEDCVYYRILGPMEGTWSSNDADHRFALTIDGDTVSWTERRPSGATLTRKVQLAAQGGGKRVSRPNDEQVLVFLDFPDAALRQEILAKGPEDSFIDLTIQGDKLIGEWHGLLVRKLPNGKLKEIVQPSQIQAKRFEFVRQ